MPARWGLQQTTLAPGSDYQKIEKYRLTTRPVLLRQGELGMSQYYILYPSSWVELLKGTSMGPEAVHRHQNDSSYERVMFSYSSNNILRGPGGY